MTTRIQRSLLKSQRRHQSAVKGISYDHKKDHQSYDDTSCLASGGVLGSAVSQHSRSLGLIDGEVPSDGDVDGEG